MILVPPTPPSNVRLVCQACGEHMGRDAHEPGDTHGSTWWYRGLLDPERRLRHCGGKLVPERAVTDVVDLVAVDRMEGLHEPSDRELARVKAQALSEGWPWRRLADEVERLYTQGAPLFGRVYNGADLCVRTPGWRQWLGAGRGRGAK